MDPSVAAARFSTALMLHDLGVDLMRQNLSRRHPHLAGQELEAAVGHWLLTRPGAEHGDAIGRRDGR